MRMKVTGFFLLISVCLLAISPICSGKELITEKQVITFHDVFEGENESWKAKYMLNESHVFITANNKTHYYGTHDYLLLVTYKGNLPESSLPKLVNISYVINIPYYMPSSGGRVTSEGQGLGTDFDNDEYVFINYFTYYGESSTKIQSPVSTKTILAIKNEFSRLEHSRSYAGRSLRHAEGRPLSYKITSKIALPALFGFKQPEQWPFRHTIDPAFTPSNTVYVRHEGSGGTEADRNNPGRVTVELNGETEILELKSGK
ncbi:hypothetical protein [Methanosarcina sp. MTP4]|uniref:hypothetical protein n=1 Tax=Methanosarcina sp. MTP4 TaxID=1434100 RepID=UPI000AF1DF4D|nr:hypothetical protein [Methanosarcina sp. MTP4]